MTVSVVDQHDGTNLISGCTVADNGDGTLTITGATVADQGDGTDLINGGTGPQRDITLSYTTSADRWTGSPA